MKYHVHREFGSTLYVHYCTSYLLHLGGGAWEIFKHDIALALYLHAVALFLAWNAYIQEYKTHLKIPYATPST